MNTANQEFGRRLRDERERRGHTLQAIADSTKIPLSLLTGLERGDIEDWPSGLFGRAHFRAYTATVGLSPEPLMAEFLRLLSNDTAPTRVQCTLSPDVGPRLTLAADRRWGMTSTGLRALASALDVCAIFTIATALARILKADLWLVGALVSLTYYALATMALGQSVTLWWLGGRVWRRAGTSTATARERVLLVLRRRRQLRDSRQQSPADFRENPSVSTAQTVSR